MALSPQNLRRGVVFSLDGQVYESLEYKQAVQGRQQSSVSVKARNLSSNKIVSHTFRGGEDLAEVDLAKESVQFLYRDGGRLHFMARKDYAQYELPAAASEDKLPYLAESQKVVLLLLEGRPLSFELPKNVWLRVESAPAVVKGDTTSAVLKEARLETGLEIRVPAFVKAGDVISVDTATGAYRERRK